MKVVIDDAVCKTIPGLKLFYKTAQVQNIAKDLKLLDLQSLVSFRLNKRETAEYKKFREKVAGKDLLAVERLQNYDNPQDLPAPDPLTSFIIQASYYTNLPLTVFSIDKFGSIVIRFAAKGDTLNIRNRFFPIKTNSLIADTEGGVLGILGIKSSSLGKLDEKTKEVAILSFGCSQATNMKSKGLVEQVTS